MTKDEALDIALAALEGADEIDCDMRDAIAAIKQVRARPVTEESSATQPAPVQDSTCSETLRAQGKAYPRTCRKCGKGPCIGVPKPEQEVSWGVDWGRAGDIPCVSIIKRLPDGRIQVLAVEYAPYSFKEMP
jgi:cytochrome c5